MTSHLIRHQRLEVEFDGTEEEGLVLQRTLQDLCWDSLNPAIERLLDRLVPPHLDVTVDRLEISTPPLSLAVLEHELIRSVTEALEKFLIHQSRMAEDEIYLETTRQRSRHEALVEAFLYFLVNGTLPWWFQLPEGKTLEQAVLDLWHQPGDEDLPHPAPAMVLNALYSSNARGRLVRQFSPCFLDTLLSLVSPQTQRNLWEVMETVEKAGGAAEAAMVRRRLWIVGFAAASAGLQLTVEELAREALTAHPPRRGGYAMARALNKRWPEAKAPSRTRRREVREEDVELATSRAPDDWRRSQRYLESRDDEQFDVELREGIYVENAGIVLLHPFLPSLFRALDVATDGTLLHPERALSLMHFLVTGEASAFEYELFLFKLLCGLDDLSEPVEAYELSEKEREEGEKVLQAAIGHWAALRNTSPDALRGAFLLRPGKVTQLPDGDWLLRVQSEACDVMLDELPWTISAVRLPWMERMLWVEWR
ncbi:hypothetical protein GMSM_17920 [Geomonas sp. Red276]